MISRLKTKFIRVSLTECDRLSMSTKIYTEYTIDTSAITQPITEVGMKNNPMRLNQGSLILKVNLKGRYNNSIFIP